ncbi:hypothetical protein Ana3638_07730 [Anaerocolumna sedimenticola]|uniref:Flagellar protein FliT n=1 Tax=Anaerocolumna sedimenticola TaxID=2696063 RepID=A0A6P1THQ2_9FIRM|nr:flagellar protein FlgN [Anaerocolumna sedimenticola]QHQ60674.1 hypothetical protein Ana3638_07730 [Anaerocolumna sedimenticola]
MDNKTYIHILTDTLIKKNNQLDKLLQITALQEQYINEPNLDMDKFEQTFAEKEEYIEQINLLDDGFEKIYLHIQDELSTKRIEHKEQIKTLQDLIRKITEKSTKLQAAELRNKNKMEAYFLNRKKEIKNFKLSSRTATNYYNSMRNQPIGESYFLDKKK